MVCCRLVLLTLLGFSRLSSASAGLGQPDDTVTMEQRRRYLRTWNDTGTQDRVIDGFATTEDRYPYYVGLFRKSGSFTCGGTLIAPDVVLTAAHCFDNGLETAKIGLYNRRGTDPNDVFEERGIAREYVNPSFDVGKKRFDQMLILLSAPSTLPYLKNINFDPAIPQVGGPYITTIGVGVTDLEGTRPTVLQQVDMTYIPNDECSLLKGDAAEDYSKLVFDDHLCSQGINGAAGQCYGDSGGPQLLLGATADEDVLVGVNSWGVDCGTVGLPSVGSRTSATTFIKDTLCEISLQPPATICGIAGEDTQVDNGGNATIPEVPSCVWLLEQCTDSSECCSQRCFNGVCRTSFISNRESLSDNRGGAAGVARARDSSGGL